MDIEKYLQKINCSHAKEVNLKNLTTLQTSHLRKIAFENFDMHMNKPIEFSLQKTYDRIVNKDRGGFCIQLNSLFSWLLKNLGYHVYLVPCYFYNQTLNDYFRLPIHVILIVHLENRKYYVDVGTSRIVVEPIELSVEKIQNRIYGSYKFRFVDEKYELERKAPSPNADWVPLIKFKLEPKELEYFKEMNDYVQTEEHPTIFYRSFAALNIPNGIRYLTGSRFTQIEYGEHLEETRIDTILSIDEVRLCIKEKFGLIIDNIECFVPVDNLNIYFESLKEKNHNNIDKINNLGNEEENKIFFGKN
ncbi:arylamine N- pineal gland isozyme NAT-3 [Brachionus plicatilis]|uniref:arylamine N-acetyltransferase n=1 Tax=Brachionus plicatilis TaxID=10195 RepID=A0A3M7S8T9_BRAPC|nr:arylamine N- pineal gland isozyme NAT-3 [Brachionus plicatilis]